MDYSLVECLGRGEQTWSLVATFSMIFLATVLIWFLVEITDKSTKKKCNLPPGPPKLPIIGNIYVLADTSKSPHQITMELSEVYGPILLLKIGSKNLVFVSDPEVTLECFKYQDQIFSHRPPQISVKKYLMYGNYHLTVGDLGEYHTFFRRLLMKELVGRKKLQSFEGFRREELSLLIRNCFLAASMRKAPETVNLSVLIHALAFNLITRIAFGKKFFGSDCNDDNSPKAYHRFKTLIPELFSLFQTILVEDCFPALKWVDTLTGNRKKMQTCFKHIDILLDNLIGEHKQELLCLSPDELNEYQAKDFMDHMVLMQLRGENKNFITDLSIKGISLDLLAAGSETTSITLEWAMTELLANPDSLKKAQEEIDLVVGKDRFVVDADIPDLPFIVAIVKETFRLHAPVPWLLPHSNIQDCKMGGYDIPANSVVNFQVYAMSRSASLWENPLKFCPERFLGGSTSLNVRGGHPQLIPFGAGRRICPGMEMSHIVLHATLARLIQSFDWALPAGIAPHEVDMSECYGPTTAKKTHLRAIPTARLPAHLYP